MKQITFFLLIGLLGTTSPYVASAQYNLKPNWNYELGGTFGVMNSLTDLGGKSGVGDGFLKDLNREKYNLSGGLYFNSIYKGLIGVRLEACWGTVEGADSVLKDVRSTTFLRYERNLSFRSSIRDIHLGVEFHPRFMPLFLKNREDPPTFSPYVVAGIGMFAFNPKAKLNNVWYELQPLRTEGQGFAQYPDRKPYKLQQLNYYLASGFLFTLSESVVARLEVNYRVLNTDYLDDVSQDVYIDPALFYQNLDPVRAGIASQLFYRGDQLNPPYPFSTALQRGDTGEKDSYFTVLLKVGILLGRKDY